MSSRCSLAVPGTIVNAQRAFTYGVGTSGAFKGLPVAVVHVYTAC